MSSGHVHTLGWGPGAPGAARKGCLLGGAREVGVVAYPVRASPGRDGVLPAPSGGGPVSLLLVPLPACPFLEAEA